IVRLIERDGAQTDAAFPESDGATGTITHLNLQVVEWLVALPCRPPELRMLHRDGVAAAGVYRDVVEREFPVTDRTVVRPRQLRHEMQRHRSIRRVLLPQAHAFESVRGPGFE